MTGGPLRTTEDETMKKLCMACSLAVIAVGLAGCGKREAAAPTEVKPAPAAVAPAAPAQPAVAEPAADKPKDHPAH
jgi:PBP1b-binding outer membrane lipoprotein LpoB